MSTIVPDEILNATTNCPHTFSCLESGKCGDHKMCEVSYADKNYVLVLKSKEPEKCPYRVDFGYCQLCECPTHSAIYRMQKDNRIIANRKGDPYGPYQS